MHFMDLRLS